MKKSYTKIPGQPLNKEIFNIRLHPSKLSEKPTSVRNYAQEVPQNAGTIEAEKGETIVGNMNNDGMPMFQKIGGKSHAQGGTILNAPENAYVYSKFNKMKIKNPYILQSFGLDPFTAKTPAQISNKYDFSDSVRGLFDPMSDKLQQKTYEMNVRNSINKLGKLALVQEGIKGFPQGIPKISEPYLINTGMSPDLFIGNEPSDFNQQGMPMAKSGGQLSRATGKRKVKITKAPNSMYKYGGGFDKYQTEGNVDTTGLAEVDRKYQEIAPKKVLQLKELTPIERYNEKLKEAMLSDDLNVLTNVIRKIEKEFPGAVEFNKSWNPFARFTTDDSDIMIANTYDMLKDRLAQQKYSKGKDILVKNKLTIEKGRADYAKNNYFKYQDMFEKMSENDPRKYSMIPQLIKLQKYLPEQHGVPELGVRGDIINPAYSYTDADWNNITKHVNNLDNILNPNKPAKYNEFENFWVNPYSGVGPYDPNRQNVKQTKQPKVAPPQTPMGARSVADSIAMMQSLPQQVNAAASEELCGYTEEEAKLANLPWPCVLATENKKFGGNIYKYGGDISTGLPKYKTDGNVKKSVLTPEQQARLDALRKSKQSQDSGLKKAEREGRVVQKSKPSITSKDKTHIDPYFEDVSEKDLSKLFIIPSEDRRKEKVQTSQDYNPMTKVHGKNVDIEQFKKRMAPYLDYFKKTYNRDFDYTNKKDVATLQKEFNPFAKKYMHDLAISKGYSEDHANRIADVFVKSQGFTGTPTPGMPKDLKVRSEDADFGEFTSSRFFPDLKANTEKAEEKINTAEKETVSPAATAIKAKELNVPPSTSGPIGKWWWQDRVQAFADLMDRASIKKYYPQNFAPDAYLPQPTFFDPNRELAQQASVASTAARAARTIFDPRQFSEIASNIQSTAAKQAADTIGRYANLNVGVANQFSNIQSNILNQYSRALAQGKTQEASQLATLGQYYDNILRQMRARQTANYKQAITNMAKTDVLNSLYPQYAVDPETGGTRPVFLRGKTPVAMESKTPQQKMAELQSIKELDPSMSIPDAHKIWQDIYGTVPTGPNQGMINPQQYPSSYPAYSNESYPQADMEEEDQGTAYNYDYWNNQYQQPSYDDTEGYDYEV